MTTDEDGENTGGTRGDELPRAPDAVLERAASCVRFVLSSLKIELDFTPETLPLVDHWLGAARAAGEETIEPLAAEAAGAYFGEVVRRTLPGARWHIAAAPSGWRIELEHVFLAFNPLGVAHEALAEDDAPGWNAHFEVLKEDRSLLEQTLGRLGDVREDDYYRLAVRWEVVEHVAAAFESAAVARGEVERRFSSEVYAAALDARPGGAEA